ncbi:hypothetical protein Pcinc_036657 [Petrolisthes cinctipes]|uniref:Uncharacterized protein n=1 Tax=Petrolisthes cinctipes TaxID=88211 RepID=A0AAE1EM54_PETCI|nr:hypothetical protein Pcinc_036657 [Petrolisthes cinctipes]
MVTEATKPPRQSVVLTLACYNNRLWALEMPKRNHGPLKGTRIFSLAMNNTAIITKQSNDTKDALASLQPEGFVQNNGSKVVFTINANDIN